MIKDRETFERERHAFPHVSWKEVACKHCDQLRIHHSTLLAFEDLRAQLGGRPIAILSGYRCPEHNRRVGGAPASYHMVGTALDLNLHPVGQLDLTRFVAAATRAGFRGIGIYGAKRFMHFDLGPARYWLGDE